MVATTPNTIDNGARNNVMADLRDWGKVDCSSHLTPTPTHELQTRLELEVKEWTGHRELEEAESEQDGESERGRPSSGKPNRPGVGSEPDNSDCGGCKQEN